MQDGDPLSQLNQNISLTQKLPVKYVRHAISIIKTTNTFVFVSQLSSVEMFDANYIIWYN